MIMLSCSCICPYALFPIPIFVCDILVCLSSKGQAPKLFCVAHRCTEGISPTKALALAACARAIVQHTPAKLLATVFGSPVKTEQNGPY